MLHLLRLFTAIRSLCLRPTYCSAICTLTCNGGNGSGPLTKKLRLADTPTTECGCKEPLGKVGASAGQWLVVTGAVVAVGGQCF